MEGAVTSPGFEIEHQARAPLSSIQSLLEWGWLAPQMAEKSLWCCAGRSCWKSTLQDAVEICLWGGFSVEAVC